MCQDEQNAYRADAELLRQVENDIKNDRSKVMIKSMLFAIFLWFLIWVIIAILGIQKPPYIAFIGWIFGMLSTIYTFKKASE